MPANLACNKTQRRVGQRTGAAFCGIATWLRFHAPSWQVTGHFFAALIVHEILASTDSERARVARILCTTATMLLENNYSLIDPATGQHTTWGVWGPNDIQYAACSSSYFRIAAQCNAYSAYATIAHGRYMPGERSGNALQLLGFLATGVRVCDAELAPKFGAAFVDLVRSHGYDRQLINALVTQPDGLATFDFRLAAMASLTLYIAAPGLVTPGVDPPKAIRLDAEEVRRLRANVALATSRYWDAADATVTGLSGGPLINWLPYMLITGRAAAKGVDPYMQLRRYPTELINWPAVNSKRLDIRPLPDWLDCCNISMLAQCLPADEGPLQGSDYLSRAATDRIDGGDGLTYSSAAPFLWYFWMARYYEEREGAA
jgi:hypothetical protein